MEFDHQELEANELFQAQSHIYKHMYSYLESMLLKCAVQLGIPDIIHTKNQPVTLLELASELHVPPIKADSLQRVMRVLVHSGLFATEKIHKNQEEEEEGYVLTTSSLLLKDNPKSLFTYVLAMLDPAITIPWFSLADSFQSNNELTAFETYYGMSFWEYGKQNQEFINFLSVAMTCDSQIVSLIVKEHIEMFKGVASLVDVGGGTGTIARTIADAYPDMKCTVLDLPQVVENLHDSKNLKFVSGDMFQFVPCAEVVLIKIIDWDITVKQSFLPSVLHNWSDEAGIKILKRCKEAIPSKDEGGKVIIIEVVINGKKDEYEVEKTKLFVDMEMALLFNGRERNEQEWERLILEAGFCDYKITATFGLNSIIEVYP